MVKPISRLPLRAASNGAEAVLLHVPIDVLQHDDGIVDHQAHRQRQAEQRDVVDAEIEQVHRAERGDQRDRHRQRRNDGCGDPPQEQEDHHDDERDRQQQGELHIVDGIADGDGAIVENVQGRCAGQLLVEARQQRPDAIDHLDRVGFRLAVDAEHDRARAVVPAGRLVVLDRVGHDRQIAQAHRPAVARGDDDVAELLAVGQLRLCLDRQRLLQVLAACRPGCWHWPPRPQPAPRRRRCRAPPAHRDRAAPARHISGCRRSAPAPRRRWSRGPARSPAARRRPCPAGAQSRCAASGSGSAHPPG